MSNFFDRSFWVVVAIALATSALPALSETAASNPIIEQLVPFESLTTKPENVASNIIGADFHGIGDIKLGEVSDIILNDQLEMIALKVGVGGVLGIDETYVAVPIKDVTFSSEGGAVKVSSKLAEQGILDALGD